MAVRSMGMVALLALALPAATAPATAQGGAQTPDEPHPYSDQLPAVPKEPGSADDASDSVDPALRDATLSHEPDKDAAPAESPMADAQPALPPAPDITVTESRLLAILTDPGGTDSVTAANSIPYVVGRSCYDWALKYEPVEGDLLLTEELILPGPARNWGTEGMKTEVNPQGSRAVTERHFNASSGVAEAGWCVAKDDPVGSYRYIIRQGEREVARFDFTVGDLL